MIVEVHICDNIFQSEAAIESIVDRSGVEGYLIEEYIEGQVLNFFVTKFGEASAVLCDPAHVIGDGIHNIEELVYLENKRRKTLDNALRKIRIEEVVLSYLSEQSLELEHVLDPGEKVYLRKTSNMATGGFCTDVTEQIHPSLFEIALNVLQACPNIPYCGIDIAVQDFKSQQFADTYAVLSVNTIPAIGMHMKPGAGKGQNAASMLVDVVFPETRFRAAA